MQRFITSTFHSSTTRSCLTLALSLLVAPSLFAGQYQIEAGGNYSMVDLGPTDIDILNLNIKAYTGPIDDSKGPLAEAAFLNQASYFEARYESADFDTRGSDFDGDNLSLGGRLVDPSGSNIIEARYSTGDSTFFPVDGDAEELYVGIGTYLNPNSSFIFSYRYVDLDPTVVGDGDTISGDYKQVISLAGGQDANIEAKLSYTDADKGDSFITLQAGGDYYLEKNISIGTSFGITSKGDNDATLISFRGEYFIENNIAVTASFETIDFDNTSDRDTISLGVRSRF